MRKINLNKILPAGITAGFQKVVCYYLLISLLIAFFSSSSASIEIVGGDESKMTSPTTTEKTTDESSTDIKTTTDETEKSTTTTSTSEETEKTETTTTTTSTPEDDQITTTTTTTTTTTPSEKDTISTTSVTTTSSTSPTLVSPEISDMSIDNNDSTKSNDYFDYNDNVSLVKTTSTDLSNIVSTSVKVLGDIDEGEVTSVVPENVIETSIYEIKFETSSNLKNVKLSVSKLENKPEEIKNITVLENRSIEVYKYLDIKLTSNETYVGETGIESMFFTFDIEKSWITDYNIDKNTIEMLRYHDGEWQHLNTTLISENETCLIFEAETPGLSTFAVVGSEIVEVSASYVEEVPEIPWILNLAIIVTSSAILIFILFKSRYIYFDEKGGKQVKNKINTKPTIDDNQKYSQI
jgi:PGF-pre-PGF domain-containing protein